MSAAAQQQQPPTDRRNWKLLVDPLLKKGLPKLFRFDGHCPPGHGNSAFNVTVVSDPRTHIPRFYARSEPCDLLLPSFKIDADYVGVPPARQVSFFGLNDNINEQFLTELCRKVGDVNEAKIYFHPETKKHLGIARVVFRHVRGARCAVERHNGASVMGGTIRCLLDPFGREVKQRYSELTTGTTVHSPPPTIEPPSASARRSISHPVPEPAKPSPAATITPHTAPVSTSGSVDWTMQPPPPLGHWPPPSTALWPPPPIPPNMPGWSLSGDHHLPPIEPTPADPTPSTSAQHPPLTARHDFTADIAHKVEELKQLGEDQKRQLPSTSRLATNDVHTDGPSTSVKRDYYGEQVRSDRNDDGRKSKEKSRPGDRHSGSRKRNASSSASSCDTVELYDRGHRHKKERRSKRSHSREPSYVEVEEKYYRRKKAGHHAKDYYRYKCRTKGVGGDDHMDSPDFFDEIEQYKLISRRYKRRGDGRHSADKKTAEGGLESVSSSSEDDRDQRSRSKHSASRRRSKDRDSASRRRRRSSSSSSSSSSPSSHARRHKRRRGSDDERRSKPARAAGQRNGPVPPLTDAQVENVSESETSGDNVEVEKCTATVASSWSADSSATRMTFSLDSRIQSILGDHAPIAPSSIPMPPEPPKMTPEQEATPSDAADNISSSATPRQMAPGLDGSPVWAQSPTPAVFWSPKTAPAPFSLAPLGFPPPPPGMFHPIMSRFPPPPSWVMPSSSTTADASRNERILPMKTEAPKDGETAIRTASKRAVDGVVNDLRAVLRKDLTRRLIENAAFRTIDSWWSMDRRQERKLDRAPQMPTTPNRPLKTATAENDLVASVQSTTTESMSATLSQLFDKETLGSGGLSGLPGFGLRAAMPKLPSFKKRQLAPARPRTPDSSDDESSEKRSRRRKRRVSSSRSKSPSGSLSSRRSSRSTSSSSSASSSRRRRPSTIDQDELLVEKIESSDDDEEPKADAEPDRASSSETDESESDESESSSSSSDEEVGDEEARSTIETREPSLDADDRSSSQTDSLSSRGPVASEHPPTKHQGTVPLKKSDSSDPLELLETMAVEDKYAPMLYDHCYIKELPIEPPPIAVVEPVPSLRPVSPPPVVPAKSAAMVVKKTEEIVEVKPALPKKRKKTFPRRPIADEEHILRKFESGGFDEEDLGWLCAAFNQLRENDETPWAHKLCWLNPPTVPGGMSDNVPVKPASRRSARKSEDAVEEQHKTGCARTEGYYKLSHKQKRSLVRRAECTFERTAIQSEQDVTAARQQAQAGREARSMQRRILTSLGTDFAESELLKVNQLKYRKKMIKFGRSQIHGWGLYALETIAPDEMIVEYVGQKIRFNVADKREKNYEKIGIGSSYLFRIDADQVIDATKRGNLARFINHSCQPNCYAKIVTVDGDKRIVIYSKGTIKQGEEITYDYKFPVEDDKIDCLCGAPSCRGTLN